MKKTNKFLSVFVGLIFAFGLIGCGNSTTTNSTQNSATANSNAPKTTPTAAATPDMTKVASGATPANYKGGANATVVVEEFADYQCPTCAVVHPMVKQLHAAFGDRVKFIFRNYPLTQIHPNALNAATAAEAASLQGKFWEMQDQLFNNQATWANSKEANTLFSEYAQKIGLDVQKFNDDVNGMIAKKRVQDDLMRAQGMNIGGTPSFFLNGRKVPDEALEFNRFKQLIDAELQKAQTATAANTTTSAPVNTTANTANTAKPANANVEKK